MASFLEAVPVITTLTAALIKLLNHVIYKENVYKFIKKNPTMKIKIIKCNYFLVRKDVPYHKERLGIVKR